MSCKEFWACLMVVSVLLFIEVDRKIFSRVVHISITYKLEWFLFFFGKCVFIFECNLQNLLEEKEETYFWKFREFVMIMSDGFVTSPAQ